MRRIGIRDRDLGHYGTMMMTLFAGIGMEHIEYEVYQGLSKEEHTTIGRGRMNGTGWQVQPIPLFKAFCASFPQAKRP